VPAAHHAQQHMVHLLMDPEKVKLVENVCSGPEVGEGESTPAHASSVDNQAKTVVRILTHLQL